MRSLQTLPKGGNGLVLGRKAEHESTSQAYLTYLPYK